MIRGGNDNGDKHLVSLIAKLTSDDAWLSDAELDQILSYGHKAVPLLETELRNVAERSVADGRPSLLISQWRPAVQTVFLLAHLKSEASLDLILHLFARKSGSSSIIFPTFVEDDLWEVLYLLGVDRLHKLEAFLLNDEIDELMRLSAATAMIQIALQQPEKYNQVVDIFARLLQQETHFPDFIGLLLNELMDLRAEALRQPILDALQRHRVWDGFITEAEIEYCYRNGNARIMIPLSISERLHRYHRIKPFSDFKRAAVKKPKRFDMPGIS